MDEHVMRTYLRADVTFVRGEGARLFDAEGREYLDLLGGIAVSALGHAHPRLIEALRDQIGSVLHTSNLFHHPYTGAVALRLARLSGLANAFFCNSGTEAVETALKIARKWQRSRGREARTGFVAMQGGFHGRTLGALSITHAAKYRLPFGPLIPGVRFARPGDLEGLAVLLRGVEGEPPPAAVVLEPIQGESGVVELPPEFLRGARELCDETDTLLVHDEVQCGSGRTGTFLAGEHAGVSPDLATLAKPIAAGVPMGVCLAAEKVADTLEPGDHGSTFGGGPLACRAALVFLEELEEGGLLAAVAERGRQLSDGLRALAERHEVVSEVRGRGLIQALRLETGAAELQRELLRRGLVTNCTAGDVLRLLPPYVITAEEVERALALLDSALATIVTSTSNR